MIDLKIINISLILLQLVLVSCKPKPMLTPKLNELMNLIDSSIQQQEKLEFKNLPIDSIYFVPLPSTIFTIYDNYEDLDGLKFELKETVSSKFRYLSDMTFVIMYHMYINDKLIDSTNFINYSTIILKALEKSDRDDERRLCSFALENMKYIRTGDLIYIVLKVEADDEGNRFATYGSLYDQLHPRSEYKDSIVITGYVKQKGIYPDFKKVEMDSTNCHELGFEIIIKKVSDLTVDITSLGFNKVLNSNKLFYLDLDGFGCRFVKRIEEDTEHNK